MVRHAGSSNVGSSAGPQRPSSEATEVTVLAEGVKPEFDVDVG